MNPLTALSAKQTESTVLTRVNAILDSAVETVSEAFASVFSCADCTDVAEPNPYKVVSREAFPTLANVAPDEKLLKTVAKSCLRPDLQVELISSKLIWDEAPNNSFTDLIYFQNQFLCCFRVGKSGQAAGDDGKIRILTSPDATSWKPVALLSLEGYDLRDPKLSETPDGKLLLNMGATLWSSGQSETLNSAVSFSTNGIDWDQVQVLPYKGQWIWHVTWNQGKAYGAAYSFAGSNAFKLKLVESNDGVHYKDLKEFTISKSPTEATLRFLPDQTMVALVRRNGGSGLIGSSLPPYNNWNWCKTKSVLGGPDFLILKDGSMWASSRQTKGNSQTCILADMSLNSYNPLLTLPSGGDCSYPGMVYKDGYLYISYYSSQTGKASIYLAIVKISSQAPSS